jgi:hypothetical protein
LPRNFETRVSKNRNGLECQKPNDSSGIRATAPAANRIVGTDREGVKRPENTAPCQSLRRRRRRKVMQTSDLGRSKTLEHRQPFPTATQPKSGRKIEENYSFFG